MNNSTPSGKRKYYRPKTEQEWREDIRKEGRGDSGRFRILTREIFSSDAYCDLDVYEQHVLKCYLNKLVYSKRNRNLTKQKSRRDSKAINANELSCTNPEIKARCKKISNRVIARARNRLVEIGFFDVIVTSEYTQPGVYALSRRFKEYPNGNYAPPNAKPATHCKYNNAQKLNARRRLKCVK